MHQETIQPRRDGSHRALCLLSGRGGCDSQMMAVATRITNDVRHEFDDVTAETGPTFVMSTGAERAMEAVAIARRLSIPVVGFGDPAGASTSMDLVITTPQFQIEGSSVLALPFAISPHLDGSRDLSGADVDLLRGLTRPIRLVLIGGTAGPWRVTPKTIDDLMTCGASHAGMTVVLTSRRTTADVMESVLTHRSRTVVVNELNGVAIRMATALNECDEVHVTGDSVSMVSEAAAAGRPVAVVLPSTTEAEIEAYLATARVDPIRFGMPGDLRRFWSSLPAWATSGKPCAMSHAEAMLDLATKATVTIVDASRTERLLAA